MIKTLDLGKKFGERVAIHKLNLSIEKGEVFGLLGPNGAGKTTFIRMVTMLARPTSGKILINGLDTAEHEQEIKQFIGIVPQHFNLLSLSVCHSYPLLTSIHHSKSDACQGCYAE